MSPYVLVEIYRRYEETYCKAAKGVRFLLALLDLLFNLKMVAVCPSETSIRLHDL
jgi:hypothetical protein